MVSYVALFIIALAIATATAQNLNVSSSSQDYLSMSQRELLQEINIVDLSAVSINARYADRLDVIQKQQEQVLLEIQNVNRTLIPLQALDLARKYCIQKYDSQLLTYDAAKTRLQKCYDQAAYITTTLTTDALANVNNARNVVIVQLPKNVVICDQSYKNNQTALGQCYVDYVNRATEDVNDYLTTARKQLDLSLYTSAVTSKTAVQCSFVVEKETLERIGETMETIQNCEDVLNNRSISKDVQDIVPIN